MSGRGEASIAGLVGRQRLFAAIVGLGVFISAVNSVLLVTVLPTAVDDIGGIEFMSWTTTIYVTASIVFSAAGGWMKARLGGRGGLLAGASLFMAGTAICAAAPAMPVLLLGRLGQGVGSGLLAAMSYTFVRSVFPQGLWPKIFALMAAVWGVAALAGPALGGVLTGMVGWRPAILSMMLPALLLMTLVLAALPRDGERGGREPFPLLRLVVLASGILAVAAAGNFPGAGLQAMSAFAGVAVLALVVLADRRAERPILPSNALSFTSEVGLGLAMKWLLIISTMPVSVYGALALQRLHGATPLVAGYVVALEALGWTASAFVVARLPARWSAGAIVMGSLLVVCGVLAGSRTLAYGPLWAGASAVALMGIGFGTCWAFLSGRVLAAARSGEEDRVASAIPTAEALGIALGAAMAGIAGNGLGIAADAGLDHFAAVIRDLVGGFAAFGLAALVVASRMIFGAPAARLTSTSERK